MNIITQFLTKIHHLVPENLNDEYEEAYKFAKDNFGDDECVDMDIDMDDNLIHLIDEMARRKRVTFNAIIVEAIEAQIEEAKR